VGLYTELFYAIIPIYFVSLLFADLLSLQLVTLLMCFSLVYVIFLEAGA